MLPTTGKKESVPLKLFLYGLALFVFFLIHNYLQEGIMQLEGFKYGSMLALFEAVGVLVCTFIERIWRGQIKRVVPMHFYIALSLLLAISNILSGLSLEYINYPIKVVFRSSKIIPTMLVGVLFLRTRHNVQEYLAAFMLSLGLILFAFADKTVSPKFSMFGIVLVSLSVCADAIIPNLQKKVMTRGADRGEVVFFSNVFAVVNMVVVTVMNGELTGSVQYCKTNPHSLFIIGTYMLMSYLAISTHVAIIKEFSVLTAVILAGARKGMTIMLSFLLFPKPFSIFYVYGGVLVFAGLIWTARSKSKPKPKTDASGSVV